VHLAGRIELHEEDAMLDTTQRKGRATRITTQAVTEHVETVAPTEPHPAVSAADAADIRASFEAEALVHMHALYNSALYLAREPSRAEDLVQETLLKAFRFWHRYERGTNCKAWLFRILTNTFINRNRRKQHLQESMDATERDYSGVLLSEQSSFYETPDTTYLASLFPEDVRQAVEGLPENFRVPVVLADLNDFSYKEIADIMDCPVGTVMSRLFRGRKRLQELLFDRAVELGIIRTEDARGDDGTISLAAYRERRKAAGIE
jgi:RNA polymerase sigma-70 factor (ECF subfamily)